jgi:long-chain acyl-CoA synthetase
MVQKPFSVEVTDTAAKGEGRIRRNRIAGTGELLTQPRDNISTVYELLQYSIHKFGDKDCMGHRNVVKEHTEEKMITKVVDGEERQTPKKWTYWELSPYIYRSFKDVGTESAALGAGLRNLGLNPGDRIELYAGTSYVPALPITLTCQGKLAAHGSGYFRSLKLTYTRCCVTIDSHCYCI